MQHQAREYRLCLTQNGKPIVIVIVIVIVRLFESIGALVSRAPVTPIRAAASLQRFPKEPVL